MSIDRVYLKDLRAMEDFSKCEICGCRLNTHLWADMDDNGNVVYCANKETQLRAEGNMSTFGNKLANGECVVIELPNSDTLIISADGGCTIQMRGRSSDVVWNVQISEKVMPARNLFDKLGI